MHYYYSCGFYIHTAMDYHPGKVKHASVGLVPVKCVSYTTHFCKFNRPDFENRTFNSFVDHVNITYVL